MRFIHVSDLHLGKRVHEFPMAEDQAVVLDSIIDLCKRERPQAIVIAGDVYDKAIPSVEAMNLYERLLTHLLELSVPILMIAGNHDSGERLSHVSSLFTKHNIHIVGVFNGTVPSVEVRGDDGGWVTFHLLPFIRAGHVRRFFPEREIKTVEEAIEAALTRVTRGKGRQVLVAHQFVVARGFTPIRTESETLQVGTADEVDVSLFSAFDYVALGHLHGMQQVGIHNVYYSGSPLPYSFSEVNHVKGALIVDMMADGSVTVRQEPLKRRRNMRRISGTLSELLEQGVSLKSLGDNARLDYLEVTLTDSGPVIDPMSRLRDVYPNVMRLLFQRERGDSSESETLIAGSDLVKKSPVDLFAEFFERQLHRPLTEEQLRVVREVTAQAEDIVGGGEA
ncbi:MAG: exonuclease SbcCD subunit D [Clostridiaceae bacterium]|nr:exonuclease SbcCD subunit D [Clostridiaceae bacterium]